MILLGGTDFPASAGRLVTALTFGLSEIVSLPPGVSPVRVEAGTWPEVSALHVDLTDGAVDLSRKRRAPQPGTEREPGPRVGRLTIRAEPLRVGPVPVGLDVRAGDVAVDFARDGRGRPLALITSAGEGTLAISVGTDALGAGAHALLDAVLAPRGVKVVSVDAGVTAEDDRGFRLGLAVTVRKLFKARFRLTARVTVDDRLVAGIPEIGVVGEGANGKFLAGLLRPHVEKYRGTEISLAALAPPGLALRDLRVEVVPMGTDRGLRLTAAVGGGAETP